MAGTAGAIAHLVETRGTVRTVDAHVTGCAFSGAGEVAFATGEGMLHVAAGKGAAAGWTDVEAHDGAVLALAADRGVGGFVSGGDDGALRRTLGGETTDIARFGGKWVTCVATGRDGRTPLIAAGAGRRVALFGAGDAALKTLEHPSTVTGVDFDGKGKRVAASHYNGASLWFVGARVDTARVLEWKGSHIGIVVHPQGEAVVTAMQENALHGWRLPDGHNMRMSGYPTKTQALSFSRTGKWLASSGADAIVLWPFFGGGPMGKAPLELAPGGGVICSRAAFHPLQDVVAAGFADGSVVLVDVGSERILPVAPARGGEVTALAWSGDGATLAWGSAEGTIGLVDLSARPGDP